MDEINTQAQPQTQKTETSAPEKSGSKFTVTSKVKELIKHNEMNCGSDFSDALDREVEALIKRAVGRAKHNDRKTVRAGDL